MKRNHILIALLSLVALSAQAQTWDFAQVGSSDAFAQLANDNALWYLDETTSRLPPLHRARRQPMVWFASTEKKAV